MDYVFDASFVGALVISDEKNIQTDHLYKKIKNEDDKYSPNIIWYEISNIFRNLVRQKRFTPDETSLLFPMVANIGIITDCKMGINYSKILWDLGNKYNLSAYDAAYLELAERKNAVLCTLDDNLLEAAKKHCVKIITAS